MLSRSYIKKVSLEKEIFFPVHLHSCKAFQSTLSCQLVGQELYYELEYIEGMTLFDYCIKNKNNYLHIIDTLNDYLAWFEENIVVPIDNKFLLLNGDSNSANIIMGKDNFVHIDNQTDFLFLTESLDRVYLQFLTLCQFLGFSVSNKMKHLNISGAILHNFFLNNRANEKDLSDLADTLICEKRDHVYLETFLNPSRKGFLQSLLSDEGRIEKLNLEPNLTQVLMNDFVNSKEFYRFLKVEQIDINSPE